MKNGATQHTTVSSNRAPLHSNFGQNMASPNGAVEGVGISDDDLTNECEKTLELFTPGLVRTF